MEGQEAADLFAAMSDVAADIKDLSRNSIRPLLDNLNKQVNVVVSDLRSLANESLKPLLAKEPRIIPKIAPGLSSKGVSGSQ